MHTLTKALVQVVLLAQLAASHGMENPPPVNKGWQRMVIETTIWATSEPDPPFLKIGTPISASWIFNSDVYADKPVSMHEFALKLAGVEYGADDLIGDSMLRYFAGTSGITGSFALRAQDGLPELRMNFFEEFATSDLWIHYEPDSFARATLNGRFVALPEPASYLLVLAALYGVAVTRRRRQD